MAMIRQKLTNTAIRTLNATGQPDLQKVFRVAALGPILDSQTAPLTTSEVCVGTRGINAECPLLSRHELPSS